MSLRNENGGALIEFAIVLPILLLLVGGLVDFGVLYYNKQVLTNASREGARAGIVYDVDMNGNKKIVTEGDIQKIVQTYCVGDITTSSKGGKRLYRFNKSIFPVTTAPGVDSLAYPNDLTVTVTFTHTFLLSSLLNIFGGGFGPTLDISAVTVMRME